MTRKVMTKDEMRKQLLEKVQQADGYVKLKQHPLLVTDNGRTTYACIVFVTESKNENKQIRVIDTSFEVWNIDDFNDNSISWLLTYVDLSAFINN